MRTDLNRLPVPMDLRSRTWTTRSGTAPSEPVDGCARMCDTAPGVTELAASMAPLASFLSLSNRLPEEGRFRVGEPCAAAKMRRAA